MRRTITFGESELPFWQGTWVVKVCLEMENHSSSKDSKTAFQELIHADHKGRIIRYELVSESGPDHKKLFTMRVLVDEEEWGTGSGPSKQAAGQAAAQMAMKRVLKACD